MSASYVGLRDGWHTFVYVGKDLLVPPMWGTTLGIALALAGAAAASRMTRRSLDACVDLVLLGDLAAIEIARICPWLSAAEITAGVAELRYEGLRHEGRR